MTYTTHNAADLKKIIETVGIENPDQVFDSIPVNLRLNRKLDLPDGRDEESLRRHFNYRQESAGFLGGGLYRHHIPALVDALSARQEFYTAYTPYQPEISQGTLQSIFEYQSMLADLTGMDVANASMYDGATAMAEAALMAVRKNRITRVAVTRATNPAYRAVLRTYLKYTDDIVIEEIPFDPETGTTDLAALRRTLDGNCAFLVQQPNYFGMIEPMDAIAGIAAQASIWGIVVNEAISLGFLEKPGKYRPDFVVGEAQSFGNPVSAGGPLLGFFCTSSAYMRHMPGRIVGMSKDNEGQQAFCLTLSTREQHIRRAKATSNICSNQGLCALRAAIYLSAMGPAGLRDTAMQCVAGAAYLRDLFVAKGIKPVFSGASFHEFVIRPDENQLAVMRQSGLAPGIAIGKSYPEIQDGLLVCVTEMNTQEECKCLTVNL